MITLTVAAVLAMTGAGSARAQTATPAPTPVAITSQVVRIPITIDYLALGAALREQLYTDRGRMPLWNGADQCQYLYVENPRFGRAGDQVKLEGDGSLMVGAMVVGNCVSPITWNGIIEVETAPYIATNMQLKFRVTDINLYNREHQKTLLAGHGFDLIKQYYIPRLETFTFDLSPAFQQFKDLVKAGAPAEVAERVDKTLATLRVEPELRADDDGIRATIDLTVPTFGPIPTPSGPLQLTSQELAAFEQKIDQWDAFLVFAVKQMGVAGTDAQLRDDLLALLLDSRYRLIAALANPQSGGPDPIRLLFIDEWQRLGQIIRDAARRGTLGSQSLQFLSFMSAGDALFALDQMAPALGMRISADDLRRLAHMIGPAEGKDVLGYSFDEDPELRKMFKMKEPLSSEGPLDTESSIVETPVASASPEVSPSASLEASPSTSPEASASRSPEASASASPEASPTAAGSATSVQTAIPSNAPTSAVPEPSSAITPAATPSISAVPPTSLWQIPLRMLTPDAADAAQLASANVDIVAKLQELAMKLKRLVVNATNASEYRGNYDQLLQYGAERELDEENIDARFRPLYLRMVKATAWQESCWRQFVLDGNRVTYLESSTHDVGLMQVNKYVWRGFYKIDRLQWDVLYNASAGMEILARLLNDIERKRGAFSPQNPDELSRSIYAAYNGGPGAYRRWRIHEAKMTRLIDNSFWRKYQSVQHGTQIDILTCSEEWGHEH